MEKQRNTKKTLKTALIAVISAVVLILTVYGGILLFVPITRSNQGVRSYVLRSIPLGTDWDDALQTIEKQNWKVRYSSTEYGLVVTATGTVLEAIEPFVTDDKIKTHNWDIIGEQFMLVYLGSYRNPFDVAVQMYLAFDENGTLIDAYTRKDVDAL